MMTPSKAAGFTLIEVAATMLLASIMLYGLHSSLVASSYGRASGDHQELVHRFAVDYLDRMRHIPFGTFADGSASPAALQEFFDDDDDLGSVTLSQLVVAVDDEGHHFTVNVRGLTGRFRIKVSNDLDGDGELIGPREGRTDLLHVQIFFDERPVLRTWIAAQPAATVADFTDYLLGG